MFRGDVRLMKNIVTPITKEVIEGIKIGDMVYLSGYIYTGRDAVLPKVVRLIETNRLEKAGIDLYGSVIFHTAVSPAGVGPTSSNKLDIEGNIPALSKAGVKLHLGKGELKYETVEELNKYNSVYAVIPPVTALLESKISERKVIAFPEEGMEAMHQIKVDKFPIIIAAAHGKSLYK